MYQQALGKQWSELPQVVQAIHSPGTIHGRFTIRRGESWRSRILATICRFPKPGVDVELRMSIERQGDRLIWRRRFGDRVLQTWQDQRDGIIRDGRGPFYLAFRPIPVERGLDHQQVSAGLKVGPFCLPFPGWLQPRMSGRIRATDSIAEVHVEIHAPLCGLVLSYQGTAWVTRGEP